MCKVMCKICFTLPHSPEAVSRVAEEERPDDAAGVEERLRERRLPGVLADPIHLRDKMMLDRAQI